MNLPLAEELEIRCLNRLFENKSECYKLFWFLSIVKKVGEGKTSLTYKELVDEMIVEAWYMVSEYHLNLGPKDAVEEIIKRINVIGQMKSSEKREVIIEYLDNCDDKEVLRLKRTLTLNVPYRLQSPFIDASKKDVWNLSGNNLAQRINQERNLIYRFDTINGFDTIIEIQPAWVEYIIKNQVILLGWIQFNLIEYLQRRNPNVPGISDKLSPPMARNLTKVKKYWRTLMDIEPVQEIYKEIELDKNSISIDHFVPWSYVAHDELWNLHPTTKSLNSSKSNYLPDWATYFPRLCKLEYQSYELLWKYNRLHEEFERCAKDHLNNEEVKRKLYRPNQTEAEFGRQLEEIVFPVYKSAQDLGFEKWVLVHL